MLNKVILTYKAVWEKVCFKAQEIYLKMREISTQMMTMTLFKTIDYMKSIFIITDKDLDRQREWKELVKALKKVMRKMISPLKLYNRKTKMMKNRHLW